MKEFRSIHKVVSAMEEEAAPGFKIKRPLPTKGLRMIDPFLLLDHMGQIDFEAGQGSGVPEHPHRGFEPVTFLFEGEIEHKDSLGNSILLQKGDVQWMTAGSGIVHSEFMSENFKKTGGKFHGVQLWVNIPAAEKMSPPKYQNIKANDIPAIKNDSSTIRVIAGDFNGETGPATTFTPILALHISMEKPSDLEIPIPSDFNAFIYVLEGRGLTEGVDVFPYQLIKYFNHGEGIKLSSNDKLDVLLLAGKPIGEKTASYGPFVMNNMMEIQQAIYDYEQGLMGHLN